MSDFDDVQYYNKLLIGQIRQYNARESSALSNKIEANLKARHDKLNKLATHNPQDFVALSMPDNLRNQFPVPLRQLIEERITISGEMEVIAWDNPENKTGGKYNKLKTSDGNYFDLYFADDKPHLKTGDKVNVRGIRNNSNIVTYSKNIGEFGLEVTEPALEPEALEMRRGAIILFNFANSPNQPFNLETLKGVSYTNADSTNTFWQEVSYSAIGIQGDGFGSYTIGSSTNGTCSYTTWKSQANALASANGFIAANYSHVMYIFPSHNTGCGWAGLAWLHGRDSMYNGSFSRFLNSHELGHNLGFDDIAGYRCQDESGQYVPLSSTCHELPYLDYGDTMGQGLSAHYQGYNKAYKGWIPASNVQTVTEPGTYTITPLEQAATTTQLLRVPSGVQGKFYYLEARNDYGYDRYFEGNRYQTGLAIRIGASSPGIIGTWLIDTTPTTGFTDAPLLVGETFIDPFINLTIRLVSKDMTQSTVEIIFNSKICVVASPTMTITPLSGPAVPAGTAVEYAVTLKNENSANCDPSPFDLVKVLLIRGWTGTFNPANLNLASGEVGRSIYTVTSLPTATDGVYPFTIAGFLLTAGDYFTTLRATYWVDNPVKLIKTVDKLSINQGDTVTYTLTYANYTSGTLINSRIEDIIPPGTTYVEGSASGEGTFDGTKVMFNVNNLSPGEEVSFTFKIIIN